MCIQCRDMDWKDEANGDQNSFFHSSTYLNTNGQLQVAKVPVVQELVRRRGLDRVPPMFKLPDILQVIPSSEVLIPTVSLAKLRDPSRTAREDELAKLRQSAEEWGMFMITDHGMDSRMLEKVKEVVKGFFDLPFEVKKASVGTRNSIDNMGYGRNFLKSDKPVDWIDRLCMKAAPAEATDGTVWPLRPPCFREVTETYVDEARKVLNVILKYLEQAFGLKEDTFTRYFNPAKSEINVRINYYPPCPSPESALGLTSHSDISALTLLMESEGSGGLQVMDRNTKNWLTVTWPKDMLLVSAGDLMEMMSNGSIQSPWHRVVAQRSVERFSVALFYNPPAEVKIEPERGCEEGAAKYRSIVVKDYLQHYYAISPTQDKQAIMYSKLH